MEFGTDNFVSMCNNIDDIFRWKNHKHFNQRLYMKIILILFLNFISFGIIHSQNKDNKYDSPKNAKQTSDIKAIPRGTSKIKIYNNLNKKENFQLIGETLIDNNFQIDKSNEDFLTISSIPKAHEKLNISYILNFIAKGSLIIVTGTFTTNIKISFSNVETGFGNLQIVNKGMIGSPTKEAFLKMYLTATKFANQKRLEFLVE
jgi:hypothetical protein